MSWLLNCLFSWSSNCFLPFAAGVYCLTLEMKRRTLRCQDWAVLRGQGLWKYSSQHRLCSHNGLAFLRSREPIPEVSLKFVCKPGNPSLFHWGSGNRRGSSVLHRYEMSTSLKNKITVVLEAGWVPPSSFSRMWLRPWGSC